MPRCGKSNACKAKRVASDDVRSRASASGGERMRVAAAQAAAKGHAPTRNAERIPTPPHDNALQLSNTILDIVQQASNYKQLKKGANEGEQWRSTLQERAGRGGGEGKRRGNAKAHSATRHALEAGRANRKKGVL